MRCCARHPQIFMPAGKEPWFFARELHVRTPPRPEGTPATLDEYLALFAAARARPARRRGHARCTCGRAPPRARSPRWPPARGSSRSCASPRSAALAAPAVRGDLRRDRGRPAHGALAGGRPARGAAAAALTPTGRRRCCTPSTCATSSSCAAITSVFGARAGAGADLRRLPRRQRGDGAPGAALPRGRRRPFRSSRSRPTRRCARARSACTSCVHAVSVGHGPLSLAVKGGGQGAHPHRAAPRVRSTRRSGASCSPSRRRRMRS